MKHYAIILGAGASRGSAVGQPTPPLDGEFLWVARSLLRKSKAPHARKIWKAFESHLDAAGVSVKAATSMRLEALSTYLEARANMSSLQLGQGQPRNYAKALGSLTRVICQTLVACNGTKACDLHRALFELVNPGAVITFNYDLVADQTLLQLGRLNWTLAEYAGSNTARLATSVTRSSTRAVPRKTVRKKVRLLKLHGSIHWEKHTHDEAFSLAGLSEMPEEQFVYAYPPKRPLIVPPVAAKMEIQAGPIRNLWSDAVHELQEAPGWIIWGYSFPLTDTVTQVLCRTALARHRKSKPVIVVNPDWSVATRIRDGLEKVKVTPYSSIERLLLDRGALRLRES